MRRVLLLASLAVSTTTSAQYNTTNLTVPDMPGTARPPVLGKLGIFPVLASGAFLTAHSGVERTVPLKRAIGEGKLAITEKAGGGQVNALVAKNTSKDTIYLMQGEVVAGGKQDRVLAQDMVLAPGETRDIGAFCVEQGRWEGGAERKAFAFSPGVAAPKMRVAVANDKNQGEVWRNVSGYLAEADVAAPTGTFNALHRDSAFMAEMERYRAHFNGLYKDRADVVGMVAVSGGQVVGCDLFATPAMFQDAYEGLLTGYITEALTRGAPVKLGAREASLFLERLLADESRLEERARERGSIFRDKGRTLRVSWF